MKPLIVDAEAEAELDAAITWYEQRREGLGMELHGEIQTVLDEIQRAPLHGWKHGEEGHHVLPVGRFPYFIYYVETADEIWVAAIAHERRHPDYWRDRSQD